MIIKPHFTP